MLNRRGFLCASSALMLAGALPGARAAGLPSQGTLLFGYPPGSIGSQLALGATTILASTAGVQYQLRNIEGRNTRLAAEMAAKGTPDGSVLLQAQSTATCLLPAVYRNLGYDPQKDFAPLACFGEYSLSLTVGPAVPRSVTTLAQYEAWVKNNPDLRDIGFAIYGSQGHLATLMLAQRAGMAFNARPYQGSGILIDDLKNGNLAAGFTAAGNGNSALWANGTLRSIGTTQARRVPYWPNVPTLQEQGVAGMDINVWYGWYAPAATPTGLLNELTGKIAEMQAKPDYLELQKRLLITPLRLTPEQIQQRTAQETAQYAQLSRSLGLKYLD
ncbi:tripartite tricarboxylate transporter substrate-binding protein [Pseudomonas sp. NPDC007930]|uniref:Bug family tripartite tricarboxylate transporter substrate binding protein n=1 Tax=Pseudomonas sp. NPDC007930 TaxID=3364417 RepID=UPI0036E290E0